MNKLLLDVVSIVSLIVILQLRNGAISIVNRLYVGLSEIINMINNIIFMASINVQMNKYYLCINLKIKQ